MIWLDLLAVAIILGAIFAESKRRFGSSLLDMLALLAAVKAAKLSGPAAARAVTFLSAPDDNQAWLTVGAFLICAAALLALARFVEPHIELSLAGFDRVVSPALGLVSGIALAHLVLFIILTANPAETDWGAAARKGLVVREVVQFRTLHYVTDALRRAGRPVL